MGVPGAIDDVQPFAELFQGATTIVYKAYQRSLDRFVLLKRLRPEFRWEEALSQGLEEEARLIARVQHPNVVAIYAHGRDEEGTYIVAEFVEGVDLRALIERGRLPHELATFVLQESARGLKAAHEKGVLHRDLKPANILISHDGAVKLTDFGMASLLSPDPDARPAAAREIRGTLAYLAPEQVLGDAPSKASDLFSLGATFYELLSGRCAFQGAGPSELFDAVLNYEPVSYLSADARMPAALVDMTAKLLRKEPSERFQECGMLLAAVDAYRSAGGAVGSQEGLKRFLEAPERYAAAHTVASEPAIGGSGGPANGPAPGAAPGAPGAAAPGARGVTAPAAFGRGASTPGSDLRLVRRAGAGALVVLIVAGLLYASVSRPALNFAGPAVPEETAEPPPEGGLTDDPVAGGEAASPENAGDQLSGGAGPQLDPDVGAPAGGVNESAARREGAGPEAGGRESAAGLEGAGPEAGARESEAGARESDAGAREVEAGARESDAGAREVEAEREADAEAEPLQRENVSQESRAPGSIVVDVKPYAEVVVGGRSFGTTPLRVELPAGTHEIVLRHREFPEHTATVEVRSGEERSLSVSLWALVGRIQVEVAPWAYVLVDGAVRDTVPPQTRPLIVKPGRHLLSIVHPVLGRRDTTIVVPAGTTYRFRFNLNP